MSSPTRNRTDLSVKASAGNKASRWGIAFEIEVTTESKPSDVMLLTGKIS